MKPDQIREEPQLISPDPSNSDMNVSMDVQPGDDPLSQLAAKSGVPKDENSNNRIQKSIMMTCLMWGGLEWCNMGSV